MKVKRDLKRRDAIGISATAMWNNSTLTYYLPERVKEMFNVILITYLISAGWNKHNNFNNSGLIGTILAMK
jgi:hypothetical protein